MTQYTAELQSKFCFASQFTKRTVIEALGPKSSLLVVVVYEAIAVANFQTIDCGCTVSFRIKACFDLRIEQVWCGNSQPHHTLKMSENNSYSQFSDNNCSYYNSQELLGHSMRHALIHSRVIFTFFPLQSRKC